MQAVVIMPAFESSNGKFWREILISQSGIGNAISQRLPSSRSGILQLEPILTDGVQGFHHFTQLNIKASRKVVLPAVKEILNNL